ncbi:uncharacterized protein VTP21DRAFT_3068 [Calcarisporiella thermophila]|uniref:uncharacterized protein n=1 Tax=Calcarisporiella thermophila TaxID=911321 RepID=UPI0037426A84
MSRRAFIISVGCIVALFIVFSLQLSNNLSLRQDSVAGSRNNAPHYRLYHPNPRLKAAFITHARNDQLQKMRITIRNIEDSFNKNRRYPYIIFSDEELSTEFREYTSALTSGNIEFIRIPSELWGYPEWIDRDLAREVRKNMTNVILGESEDYRFQSRFFTGLIFRHPIMKELDYFWRIEAGTEYMCDILYDPFEFMKERDIKMTFSISLHEYEKTIPTLWEKSMEYASLHPELPFHHPGGLSNFMIDERGKFNLCHMWTNFIMGDLSYFRSDKYTELFNYFDRNGGIFYERWGDAMMISIAAVLLLRKDQVYWWNDIGYRLHPFTHCPSSYKVFKTCTCRLDENFDYHSFSCLKEFIEA